MGLHINTYMTSESCESTPTSGILHFNCPVLDTYMSFIGLRNMSENDKTYSSAREIFGRLAE
jgi:hypothetical protein